MKKLLIVIHLLIFNFIFSSNAAGNQSSSPVIVEITDATLENIYYEQNNFSEPTKLVFTNLTTVTGSVYFNQNANLVEIDFPLLESTGDYFSIAGNADLTIVNSPNLVAVGNYLYVESNTLLQQLNICNLTEILEVDPMSMPYYYIANNNSTIDTTICFSQGAPNNLTLDNSTIAENQDINTLIGILNADSNYTNGSLTYYLTEAGIDNNQFTISSNELRANASFDYETQNTYTISLGVRNQLGEKLESEFSISIEDVTNESVTIIEITDTTLDAINYDQNNFTEPTKLVFTNLTTVTESIYFNQNANLVEIDFPLLENTGDYVYLSGNTSMTVINAPNLNTISNYLYIEGNTALQQLNICNLTNISEIDTAPYYYIENNNSTIDSNLCFSQGAPENLTLDNTSIAENQNINTLIGTLNASSNYTNGSLTYYLTETRIDNAKFAVIGNELVTATPLDYEAQNTYSIKLGVRNQLGEKLEAEFTINIENVANETVTIIEITDTTLDAIYYEQDVSFVTPTKLVFTNLTTVTGSIYFNKNINLVEIDFPLLENTGDYVYLSENSSLHTINAPTLTTVGNYLYVSGNSALQQLNSCSLSEITASADYPEPYYYIRNNPVIDFSTTCLISTNITFNPVASIVVQPAPNTLIGTFSIDGADASNTNIRYYFVDENGAEITSDDFVIVGNSLYLSREYNEYTTTDFTLTVHAIRTYNNNGGRSSAGLNEKIDLTISFSISNTLNVVNFAIEDQIQLFPNPTNSFFNIQSNYHFKAKAIYNTSGQLIKTFKPNETTYDVSKLPVGIYMLTIEQLESGTLYSKKLVINY